MTLSSVHTLPRHTEIGTVIVSLPASSRCVSVREFIDRCTSTAADVHSCRVQAALTSDWYAEYVADIFQDLMSFSGP